MGHGLNTGTGSPKNRRSCRCHDRKAQVAGIVLGFFRRPRRAVAPCEWLQHRPSRGSRQHYFEANNWPLEPQHSMVTSTTNWNSRLEKYAFS